MDSSDDCLTDPIEIEMYRRFIHKSEECTENMLIELVADLVHSLKPQQIELFYLIFGEMKQQQEVADIDNVTRQAVCKRCKKFIELMQKLLEAHGVHF